MRACVVAKGTGLRVLRPPLAPGPAPPRAPLRPKRWRLTATRAAVPVAPALATHSDPTSIPIELLRTRQRRITSRPVSTLRALLPWEGGGKQGEGKGAIAGVREVSAG
jgi:hypothetical protein